MNKLLAAILAALLFAVPSFAQTTSTPIDSVLTFAQSFLGSWQMNFPNVSGIGPDQRTFGSSGSMAVSFNQVEEQPQQNSPFRAFNIGGQVLSSQQAYISLFLNTVDPGMVYANLSIDQSSVFEPPWTRYIQINCRMFLAREDGHPFGKFEATLYWSRDGFAESAVLYNGSVEMRRFDGARG